MASFRLSMLSLAIEAVNKTQKCEAVTGDFSGVKGDRARFLVTGASVTPASTPIFLVKVSPCSTQVWVSQILPNISEVERYDVAIDESDLHFVSSNHANSPVSSTEALQVGVKVFVNTGDGLTRFCFEGTVKSAPYPGSIDVCIMPGKVFARGSHVDFVAELGIRVPVSDVYLLLPELKAQV